MKKILNTKIKDMKAITLIALVITIVILIILAGVLVSITLGNNGLFNKAKLGKELYANAQDYEDTQIAKTANEIDSHVSGNRETIMVDKDEYEQMKSYINDLKNNRWNTLINIEGLSDNTGAKTDYTSFTVSDLSQYKGGIQIQISFPYDNEIDGSMSTLISYDELKLTNSSNKLDIYNANNIKYFSMYYESDTSLKLTYHCDSHGTNVKVFGIK